jgi:dipeptidase D
MSDHPEIRLLEPKQVWNHFCDLNAVPRASKKEERVIEFMKSFGDSLNLDTSVDHAGNVIIRKSATPGKEDRKTLVLQSHLDMVHQKNNDTVFDFATQGIQMLIDGDWVKAQGTTLGADNGLGVAAIMSLLASEEIAHPPLEALFTIDEETGMTGAKELKAGVLTGEVMLNLDTEEDDELTIGCAGGVDVVATGTYTPDDRPDACQGYKVIVRGLTGGHSGMDIHLGRGNANKIMNRIMLLASQNNEARLASIDGGGLRNAIPRESSAVFLVPNEIVLPDQGWFKETSAAIKAEYQITDPNIEIVCQAVESEAKPVPEPFQQNLIAALCGVDSGIHRMSPSMAGLVQTSNNLARVFVGEGKFSVDCLTRSSINSERHAYAQSIATVLATTGASVEMTGDYPGWLPNPDSEIVQTMKTLYEELFNDSPKVSAGHGGLECGLLGQNYPDMQMISFGPTIRGAHSPDERASISSTQKFWKLLLATLDRI